MTTMECAMRKFLNLAAAATVLLAGSLLAQPFEEGKHYQPVGNPVATPDDRVVVVDGFGYPCPACRRFMPYLESWEARQPEYVEVEHLPVALQPGWDLFAKA